MRKNAKLMPDKGTAHISSHYRAVQLKHSSACHLLGNLFTLYAGINIGVTHIHMGLHMKQFYYLNIIFSTSSAISYRNLF